MLKIDKKIDKNWQKILKKTERKIFLLKLSSQPVSLNVTPSWLQDYKHYFWGKTTFFIFLKHCAWVCISDTPLNTDSKISLNCKVEKNFLTCWCSSFQCTHKTHAIWNVYIKLSKLIQTVFQRKENRTLYTLFRKNGFFLDEMFQWNTSNWNYFFSYIFRFNECPRLCREKPGHSLGIEIRTQQEILNILYGFSYSKYLANFEAFSLFLKHFFQDKPLFFWSI